MKTRKILCLLTLCAVPAFGADRPGQSAFAEVIKDVKLADDAARENDPVNSPEVVRTGADSRAELTASDHTVTRIGANTVFSFGSTSHDINLEQGSVLFHSPNGKSSGSIRSGGACATVTGTTVIVAAAPGTPTQVQNGFKVIVLEGKAKATLDNGHSISLKAGQMIFISPGQTKFGPVLDINLSRLVAGSKLVNGFSHPLPSLALVQAAIASQDKEIKAGRASDTGVSADYFARQDSPRNGYDGIDVGNYQIGIFGSALKRVMAMAATIGSQAPAPPTSGSGFTLQWDFPVGGGPIMITRDKIINPVIQPILPPPTVWSGGGTPTLPPSGGSAGATSGEPPPTVIPILAGRANGGSSSPISPILPGQITGLRTILAGVPPSGGPIITIVPH